MVFFANSIKIVKNYVPSIWQAGRRAGYTLVEVLVVVGLIAAVSAAAYVGLTNVAKNTTETKLMQDVATINRAAGIFQASGGGLDDVSDPQAVVDRLKSKLTGTEAKQMAGMRGSLVDLRLKVVAQSASQAASGEQRAYWNPGTHAFYVATAGTAGVREFVLDDALAEADYGSAARSSSFKLATVKPWIWDSIDGVADAKAAPRRSGNGVGINGVVKNPDGPLQLRPPEFSIVSGSFPLTNYPLPLTLTNPNPADTSNVLYSINNRDWRVFVTGLLVNPTETVRAMAASIRPDKYSDSGIVTETYTSTPISPELEVVFPQLAFTYMDLGGAMAPTNSPFPGPTAAGSIQLTNASSIPDAYEGSAYFTIRWTLDGSNPFTSNTALNGPPFANGYVAPQLPLKLEDFVNGPDLSVQAVAATQNPNIFTDSPVVSTLLHRSVVKLRPPLIAVDGRNVTLTFDFSNNDVPEGAYIQYTVDGSDPGLSAGLPTGGSLYLTRFKLDGSAGSTLTINARVYAPPSYLDWFEASDVTSQTVTLPVSTEFYVGGTFVLTGGVNGSGGPMRNIARLAGNGSVDASFDVGAGATANSLVGVIRANTDGVLAGGDFDDVNLVVRPAVVRLRSSGSVDTSFDAGLAGGK